MASHLATEAFELSAKQAAEYLAVHPDTLKRWAKAGKVRCFKTPGGYFRFRRSDLDYLTKPAA